MGFIRLKLNLNFLLKVIIGVSTLKIKLWVWPPLRKAAEVELNFVRNFRSKWLNCISCPRRHTSSLGAFHCNTSRKQLVSNYLSHIKLEVDVFKIAQCDNIFYKEDLIFNFQSRHTKNNCSCFYIVHYNRSCSNSRIFTNFNTRNNNNSRSYKYTFFHLHS